MPAQYSDKTIQALLNERKLLHPNYRSKIQLRDKRGHKERDIELDGENGNRFRLILRQSTHNPLDFSIILGVFPAKTNQLFRLRRYNGKSHEHTNLIEGNRFYSFHVHMATERYQELDMREDGYAEATSRFSDFYSALRCMLEECGFDVPKNRQQRMF